MKPHRFAFGAALPLAAWLACAGAADVRPPHHAEDGFRNPDPEYRLKSFEDVRRWRRERAELGIAEPDSYHFDLAENDPAFLRANRSVPSATWIGHATMLLQLGGMNVLTDPHFSERASPVQWAGPKRTVAPGLALEDLPPIDLVVISHDHYDSLDVGSIRALRRRAEGERTLFAVPLGMGDWFRNLGVDNVREFDWWQSHTLGPLVITATPAQHWSQRRLLVRNETLWSGWVIAAPEFRVYFSGDSGYAPLFRDIGARLGPFDLALLPIGAYAPRWFMRANHMDPEEAVRVHREVGARRSIALHWGTFVLSDEPLTEPPQKLAAARAQHGVGAEEFMVLQHGETRLFEPAAAP